jgi:D-3-phosphoglycerate dehydrogenase
MKCIIVDDVHATLFSYLKEAQIQYDYVPEMTASEAIEKIKDYDGLVIRSKFKVTAAHIEQWSKLKFIARAGAGLDNIDEEAVKAKGVKLIHAAQGNKDAVAEHTVGLILALLNNIVRSDKQVRQGIWEREGNRGYELSSMTVGIIGFGNMGRETAHRLQSFGCTILSYDKYKRGYGDKVVMEVRSNVIKKECDIISLHIPLTGENKFWFNRKFMEEMQKPFWLINTARGEIISFEDLVWGIESGKIRGAALDVLENEKLASLSPSQRLNFEKLTQMDNVIFTPHVAGWTFESYEKISKVIGEKLLHWSKPTI